MMEWKLLAFTALFVAYIHVTFCAQQTVYSSCIAEGDGQIIKSTGAIMKYPQGSKYGANEHCKWTVDVAGRHLVSIFKFNLEKTNDFVEIRDKYNESEDGQRKKKWSGNEGEGQVFWID